MLNFTVASVSKYISKVSRTISYSPSCPVVLVSKADMLLCVMSRNTGQHVPNYTLFALEWFSKYMVSSLNFAASLMNKPKPTIKCSCVAQ